MGFERLERGEWIAVAGGILLAVALFLGWYHLQNANATLGDHTGPATLSAWQAHPILRWFLLAGAAAPLILAWIVMREHALSWPRGEMTAVTAIAALGLLLWVGLINRPGDPRSLVHLRFGWVVAAVGAALMLVGAVMRTQETETRRKPPGTI
jgi:hypothetical protein